MATSYEQFESGEIEIRVRYPEADQMGVLHHSRYWIYFEMGRTELLRATGLTYRDIEASGVFLVLSKCSCKYIASAFYDDVLILKTTTTKMGTARIDHAYELRRKDNGTLIATAETTLACVGRDGKVQPLPDSIRQYNQE
jgi:acyl-CoA thioester hydrolase